ncbi:SDR family NAD(P)-dependent oxidoreductase [Diaminobutyricibacter sp. McL0618]|uniref:SDR family NAD(P)-dependent oxidoreductase n=1 Tax=Leifsonia sp. McL0618 TaxID=3415677 RepID=UPI003CF9E784
MSGRRPPSILPDPVCAVVVGGSGGIGQAIVRALPDTCERVFFTYHRSRIIAEDLAKELSSTTREVIPIQVDISDDAAWQRALEEISESADVDLLVNAAGISEDALCIDVPYESVVAQYQVNVFAAWRAMSILGRDMAYNHRGRIVNIASIAATVNSPGRSVYGSTKAALVSLTKSFAVELGRFNIRVNAVAPGFVETDMIAKFDESTRVGFLARVPLGRFALPDEVAQVVRFLSTSDSGYLHGAVLTMDGGTTA